MLLLDGHDPGEIPECQAEIDPDRLLRELEEVWSFLDDGLPGLEADLESHSMEEGNLKTSTSRKGKRGCTKEEEIRRLEEELELVRN